MSEQQTEQKTCQQETKYMPKTLEAFKLVEAGLSPKQALQAVNYTSKISPTSVSTFKQKLKKHSLTAPKLVKSAHNQIARILAAETREIEQQKVTKDGQVIDYTETIAPSDTNILAAAALVYDRYEPVVRQSVQINIDVDPINLDAYRNKVACDMHSELSVNVQAVDIIKD